MRSEDESIPVWWNLDLYLADHISAKLQEFLANSQGHPSDFTEEEWNSKLYSIAARLEAYSLDKFNVGNNTELMENAKSAIAELADIFPYLWD